MATQMTQPVQIGNSRILEAHETAQQATWYAAYTSPRHEKRVAQQLDERQIESFLPTYRSVRRWKDRKKTLELPLFPSYIFVQIGTHKKTDCLRIPGVLGLVTFQGKPAVVATAEIENLRHGLSDRTIVQPHPYLKEGRRVRVRSGAMAGVEGIFVKRKDRARVVLSISLLQRSVSVDIDEADIEPLR